MGRLTRKPRIGEVWSNPKRVGRGDEFAVVHTEYEYAVAVRYLASGIRTCWSNYRVFEHVADSVAEWEKARTVDERGEAVDGD